MPNVGSSGSVRGVLSNEHPYREPGPSGVKADGRNEIGVIPSPSADRHTERPGEPGLSLITLSFVLKLARLLFVGHGSHGAACLDIVAASLHRLSVRGDGHGIGAHFLAVTVVRFLQAVLAESFHGHSSPGNA